MLVLIVEDDREVRESLERCLGFEGYDVLSAADGEAGLVAAGSSQPDAVLLDLQLPRMDGLEVCRRLRASGDGLLARLRALIRRSGATSAAQETVVVDDLRLVVPSRELTRDGHPIELTRTEFDLLELLMLHPRQVLTRTQILHEVWGFDHDPGSNTLEVYVGYLRRKTEEYGGPRLIHTVRGVGYVLRPAARDGAAG
jgi:two-component system response regulator MprA